jgi:hypothetical protein
MQEEEEEEGVNRVCSSWLGGDDAGGGELEGVGL